MIQKPLNKNKNYLDKETFSKAVTEAAIEVQRCIRENLPPPKISEYLAKSFYDIALGVSRKKNFVFYEFIDDMISDAIYDCMRALRSFDPNAVTRSGKVNAFGYFTQVVWFAFLRRIKLEKKYLNRKQTYVFDSESSLLDLISDAHTLDPIIFSMLQRQADIHTLEADEDYDFNE